MHSGHNRVGFKPRLLCRNHPLPSRNDWRRHGNSMHKSRAHRSQEFDKRNMSNGLHGMDCRDLLRQLQRIFLGKCNRLSTQIDSAENHRSVVWQLSLHCTGFQLRLERYDSSLVSPWDIRVRLFVFRHSGTHGTATKRFSAWRIGRLGSRRHHASRRSWRCPCRRVENRFSLCDTWQPTSSSWGT
jgi:hypothetical protein